MDYNNFSNLILFPIEILIALVFIYAGSKIFEKAGKPGWAVIVPLYNLYTLVEVAGFTGWLFLLYFVPVINIIFQIFVGIGLAKAFGKSTIFGVIFLWLLIPIGLWILGVGKGKYIGKTINTPSSSLA